MNKPYLNSKSSLPPGTLSGEIEYFVDAGKGYCRTEGNTYEYPNFPKPALDFLDGLLEKYPEKVGYIIDEFGLEDLDGQRLQLLFCMFGAHSNNPDVSASGNHYEAEYVDCGRRDICKVQGKLCCNIVLKHGVLRPSEVKVLAEIGNGLLDKEIAEKLGISENTIRHHKDAICKKSGLERKSTLSVLADRLGLTDIEI